MTVFTPSEALVACETALRSLMTYCYEKTYGGAWLDQITSEAQRDSWRQRAISETDRHRKGVSSTPGEGLSYSNFYDLVTIAEKHWSPLAKALGRQKDIVTLLRRFDNLRNTVGHSRPLLVFEQELLSGIAGQITNQVTIYMSEADDAGDIYPRIAFVADSFGRRIEPLTADGELAGYSDSPRIIVRPGDVVTFECSGFDPQGRRLEWQMHGTRGLTSRTGESGETVRFTWEVTVGDISDTRTVSIYLLADQVPYHRFGFFDHRAWFSFVVRPN